MEKTRKIENKQCAVIKADFKHQNNYRHRFYFDDRDSEADCIERIQELINTIYQLNPNLDYEHKPSLILSASCEDNPIPEFMKINRRMMIIHSRLSDLMDELTELQQEIELLYNEAGVILDIIDEYMENEKYTRKL
jgi:hypothetical protein